MVLFGQIILNSKTPPSFTVMKTKHTHNKRDYKYKGFTLVETAIAMGMVAVMISSFLVVFGPAIKGIDKSLSAKEADRLTNALELELNELRNGENYPTSFQKAFTWIPESNQSAPVLIYQYRGKPNSVRADGTLNPFYDNNNIYNPDPVIKPEDEKAIPGKDYVIQTSVRRLGDSFHNSKIQAELYPGNLVGKVYYAKMKQLVWNTSGKMVDTGDPEEILVPQNPYPNTTIATYPEAVIAFKVEMYAQPNALYNTLNPPYEGDPVITKNMAVRR
jgi:type II secretory pathway pseudopilin PulG